MSSQEICTLHFSSPSKNLISFSWFYSGTCRSSRIRRIRNFTKRRNDRSWCCDWMGPWWRNPSFPCKLILWKTTILISERVICIPGVQKHQWNNLIEMHLSDSYSVCRLIMNVIRYKTSTSVSLFYVTGPPGTWRIWTNHRRESRCNSSSSQSEWYSHNTKILQTLCYVWW